MVDLAALDSGRLRRAHDRRRLWRLHDQSRGGARDRGVCREHQGPIHDTHRESRLMSTSVRPRTRLRRFRLTRLRPALRPVTAVRTVAIFRRRFTDLNAHKNENTDFRIYGELNGIRPRPYGRSGQLAPLPAEVIPLDPRKSCTSPSSMCGGFCLLSFVIRPQFTVAANDTQSPCPSCLRGKLLLSHAMLTVLPERADS